MNCLLLDFYHFPTHHPSLSCWNVINWSCKCRLYMGCMQDALFGFSVFPFCVIFSSFYLLFLCCSCVVVFHPTSCLCSFPPTVIGCPALIGFTCSLFNHPSLSMCCPPKSQPVCCHTCVPLSSWLPCVLVSLLTSRVWTLSLLPWFLDCGFFASTWSVCLDCYLSLTAYFELRKPF